MVNTTTGKIILAISVVFAVIILLFLATFVTERTGKTLVHISAFPSDVAITIDGEKVKTGTIYLEPGTYKIEAKKDGYDNYSKTLVLGETEQNVAIIPTPNSEEALEWGRKNEAAYRKVQAQGEVAAAVAGKTFNELNPIAKSLPDKTFFYSIGYRMDQSDPSGNSIIIEIDAPEGYKQSALNRIRQLGYDPTDFTINFRDYENPFPL